MVQASQAFEDHAVGVVNGLAACADGWVELVRLGLPEADVGFVVSETELRRAGGRSAEARESEVVPFNGRTLVVDPLDMGRAWLHASHGYPAELVGRPSDSASAPRWSLDGLLSEREGRALAEAILAAGASLWVRTNTPAAAERAASVLLRISTERVRTFSRAASPPRAE